MYGQIAELVRMPIAELRERYREVFGEQTTTAHKQHLVRMDSRSPPVPWLLAGLAEGASQSVALARHDAPDRFRRPSGRTSTSWCRASEW